MAAIIDLIGKEFGRLTVVSKGATDADGRPQWNCRCNCGQSAIVRGAYLRSGRTLSCGCLRIENAVANSRAAVKHGHASRDGRSSEYKSWRAMLSRCENPKAAGYDRYGKRGISVCARWHDFSAFLADMGLKPSPKHSIDRFPNNDGNYEPGNCRWATRKDQEENKGNRARPSAQTGAAL